MCQCTFLYGYQGLCHCGLSCNETWTSVHVSFRSAASLVKVLGGIADRPLLTRKEVYSESNASGGLVIAGSYTQKTTMQLEKLHDLPDVQFIPFNSDLVLDSLAFSREIERCRQEIEATLREGKTAVCYTSRIPLKSSQRTAEEALKCSVMISGGLQSILGSLNVPPSFIIGKGGITSSDLAVKALKIRSAWVLGQIEPGISVWRADQNSKFPQIPYIVFPGNVGNADTLFCILEKLQISPH